MNKNKFVNSSKKVIIETGKGIKSYLKAQLTLMMITAAILFIGFNFIGAPYPFLLALAISILDLIPIIGIGIVMLPWAIISLIMNNSQLATGLAVLFVITVVFRQIIEPKIVGDSIGIRPIYTLAITILGSLLLGPVGIILGPVIAIAIRAVYVLQDHEHKL